MTLAIVLAAATALTSAPADRPEPVLIPNHRWSASSFEFSPADKWLMTMGSDKRLIVWEVGTLRPARALWLPPNRRSFAARFASDDSGLFVLEGTKLTFYPLGPGEPVEQTLEEFSGEVCAASIDPTATYVAARLCFYGGEGLEIQHVGEAISKRVPGESWQGAGDLRWSGTCVAGRDSNKRIHSADARTGQPCALSKEELARLFVPPQELRKSQRGRNGFDVRVRGAAGKPARSIGILPVNAYDTAVVSHGGRYVAADVRQKLVLLERRRWRMYDLREQRWIEPDAPDLSAIQSLHFNYGSGLVSIDEERSIAAWAADQLESGALVGGVDSIGFDGFALSDDGNAWGGLTDKRERFSRLISSNAPLELGPSRVDEFAVHGPLRVSNDGKWLAYIAFGRDQRDHLQIDGPWTARVCSGQKSEKVRFAFNSDSTLLAVSCGGTLSVVDLEARRVLPALATVPSGAPVAFEYTRNWLVTTTQGGVDFRDPRTLEVQRHFAAGGAVIALAFRPFDHETQLGAALVSGQGIALFFYDEDEPIAHLRILVPDQDARVLCFDDVENLITGGQDGLIRFWEVATGDLRAIAAHATHARFFSSPLGGVVGDWVAVAPEGPFDGSGRGINWLSWRRPSEGKLYPSSLFFGDLYAPGLLASLGRKGSHLENGWDVLGPLRFPGLGILLQQQQISLRRTPTATQLCLPYAPDSNVDLYLEGEKQIWSGTSFVPADQGCPYSVSFEGHPQVEVLNQFLASHGAELATPWDNVRDRRVASRVHFQAIWIDKPADKAFTPLESGSQSTKAIRTALESLRSATGHPSELVVHESLRDPSATRAAILERLEQLAKESRPQDLVVLYIAGHGKVPFGRTMFHLVTYDADDATTFALEHTALSSADLADVLRKFRAKRVIVLVEACQSGAALEGLAKAAEAVATREAQWAELENDHGLRRPDRGVSIQLLASSSPLQLSRLTAGAPGRLAAAFAAALEETSRRGTDEGVLWNSQLLAAIERNAKAWPANQKLVRRSLGFDFAWSESPERRQSE